MNDAGKSTEQFGDDLRKIREAMEARALATHKANNELQKTIGLMSARTLENADRFENLAREIEALRGTLEAVREVAQDVREVRQRLIGDDELKSAGLIQQVSELERRVSSVEEVAEDNRNLLKYFKWERKIVIGVFVAIGGVITFFRGTNFFHWLGSP